MKSLRAVSIVMLLLAVLLAGCGSAGDSGSVGDVGRFLDSFAKAMETGDPDRVAALHDYPVIIVNHDGERENGDREEIRALYALSMAFLGDDATIQLNDYDSTVAGNTATVDVVYNVDSSALGSYETDFKWGLKWNGSAWRITEHYMVD